VRDINNNGITNSPTLPPPSSSSSPSSVSTSPNSARSSGTQGQRGSTVLKQGVYRPCARCRVKKTKCDRLKPVCTSCIKGGADVICVYDNDEPVSDSGNSMGDEIMSSTSTTTSTVSPNILSSSIPKKEYLPDPKQSNTKKAANLESSNKSRNTGKSQKSPTNGNGTRSESETSINVESALTPHQLLEDNKPSTSEPSSKKLKSGQPEAIKPSPLRSSITTIQTTSSKSSSDTGSKSTRKLESVNDETMDIESMDGVEDKDVLGLSIAHAVADRLQSEAYQDEISDTMETPTKRTVIRQKKQSKISTATTFTGNVGYGTQRIMSDLPTSRLAQPFIIDKNQKARKWGRSSAVVQTLGGEITLPLWMSDQEMLLNEPRPYFIQRSYPMPSTSSLSSSSLLPGSTSATATNLARLAVMNQKENFITGYDTPERGTSPDSGGDSSPSATVTAAHSPRTKKKRGHKRFQRSNIELDYMEPQATSGAKRKRGGPSSSAVSVKSSGGGDEDAGDSSARSTPAPSSRPRPVPTRPRDYPCSFEGCTKSFMDKFHLKRHETRHITQVIVCGIDGCTKAYDSISTMRRHRSMVHKERKEEIAAAEKAAVIVSSGAYASRASRSSGDGDGDDGEGEGEIEGEAEGDEAHSDISESPAPSSAAYTAVSSPSQN
ncbi:hypothetical protein BGZ76_001042, partial [Entomortierella beljakovae]